MDNILFSRDLEMYNVVKSVIMSWWSKISEEDRLCIDQIPQNKSHYIWLHDSMIFSPIRSIIINEFPGISEELNSLQGQMCEEEKIKKKLNITMFIQLLTIQFRCTNVLSAASALSYATLLGFSLFAVLQQLLLSCSLEDHRFC